MKQYRQLKPFTHHQLLAIKAEFIRQSLTAAKGKPESLAWFDSLIKPWQKNLVTRQPVLVMDFGGSYFRSGVAEVDDNQQLIWRRALISVKIVREYTNVDTFVNWLADKTAPLIKQLTADRVGFVFSHAFDSKKSNGHITGIITYLSKALVIPGLLGKDLGRFFLKALQLRGLHLKKFVMLNDTVALALCAKNAPAGLVIGTGANLCSLHPTLPHLRNLEAGHFNGVPHSFASIYADLMENPTRAMMEKQSTGLYQYQNLAFASLQAGLQPVISQAIMQEGKETASLIVTKLSNRDFNLLKSIKLTSAEKNQLTKLSKIILQNSYQMWAAAVAAVIELNQTKIKEKIVSIPVTGGVILNDPNYYAGLKSTIKALTKRPVQLIKVADPIKGAAVAALME